MLCREKHCSHCHELSVIVSSTFSVRHQHDIHSSISTNVQFTWQEGQGEEEDCSQLPDVATLAGQILQPASLGCSTCPDHTASQPAASAVTLS